MVHLKEVDDSLHLLASHPSAFAWSDLGDKGSPCYRPYTFASKEDAFEEALTMAAVRVAMPKSSALHKELAREVATQLGCKFISYDWLVKACGRLLSGFTYPELKTAASFATNVQARMKALSLTSIHSLADIGM